jgi:hypothetical protein
MSLETIKFLSPIAKNFSLTSYLTFSYVNLSPIVKEIKLVSAQLRNLSFDIGTIILLDCGVSIVDATVTNILVEKPDGKELTWIGSIYDENFVKYTIKANDWDLNGTWKYQAYVETPNWKGKGETVTQIVHKKFK